MYDKLAKIALQMRSKAYAPYSHFTVGVALLARSGEVYEGTNIENASFGATICAERVAISRAIIEGENTFDAIAIAGAKEGEEVLKPCYPCGICVQTLSEFFDADTKVILVEGDSYSVCNFSDIAPATFGKEDL